MVESVEAMIDADISTDLVVFGYLESENYGIGLLGKKFQSLVRDVNIVVTCDVRYRHLQPDLIDKASSDSLPEVYWMECFLSQQYCAPRVVICRLMVTFYRKTFCTTLRKIQTRDKDTISSQSWGKWSWLHANVDRHGRTRHNYSNALYYKALRSLREAAVRP